MGSSEKKFARKLSEINVVDEQVKKLQEETDLHLALASAIEHCGSPSSSSPGKLPDKQLTSGLFLVTGGHYIFYCYPCFVIDLLTALKYWMYDICYSIARWIYEHVC
uniref:Uncharacterized protein n=1 Tax=Gossypium raimondii TaxID=29730 RepID=A0A0D2UUM2_GOSRA|nr:hypothetical protein B456_011G159300 [Gossypium raimondii]